MLCTDTGHRLGIKKNQDKEEKYRMATGGCSSSAEEKKNQGFEKKFERTGTKRKLKLNTIKPGECTSGRASVLRIWFTGKCCGGLDDSNIWGVCAVK